MSAENPLRRATAFAIAVAVLFAFAVACGGGDSTKDTGAPGQGAGAQQPGGGTQSGGPEKEQVFRFALADEPPFMDPAMATDGTSLSMIRQVYVGLVRFDKDLKVVPWAASKWDVSADGKTYTFTIVKGIKWHDGQGEVKAGDFKYAIERTLKRKDSTVALLYLGDIVGAKDLQDGKLDTLDSVKVVDDSTLAITIDQPKAYFLGKLVYPTSVAVKKDAIDKAGEKWATEAATIVGAGPFKLTTWDHDRKLVLTRFDDYFEGKAALSRIERPIIKDENTRMSLYEAGELDRVDVPSGQIERVQSDAKLKKQLIQYPTLSIYYLAMNQAKAPFDKPEVRQAFNYAVEKAALTDIALKGLLAPADGIVPPGMPGFNKELKPLKYDAAKAKQLLAQAGYPNGQGFPDVKIVTRQGAGTLKKVSEALTGIFKQSLGIDLKVEEMEFGAFLAEVQRGNAPPSYVLSWGADYPDPQNFLDILFHTGSRNNRTNYHNAEVDALLDQANVERDFDKRMKLYNQSEQLIINDTAWVPLAFGKNYWLQREYVEGTVDTPMGLLYYYSITSKRG